VVNRALRLREEAEVREARAQGKAYADGPLVARVLANGTDPARNRYAVIAGKRVGKAVQRNRCKRLAREAIRALHPRLLPGYDIVIIVRGTVEELTGLDVAQGSLERIFTRARLIDLRHSELVEESGHHSGSSRERRDSSTGSE
jgi:ribonuclease P protein component